MSIPTPKKLNREIVPLLDTLSRRKDFFPLCLCVPIAAQSTCIEQLGFGHEMTHLVDSFKYALDGFRNPAGIEAKSATVFGALPTAVAPRAASSTSCIVLRSGWTLTCELCERVGMRRRAGLGEVVST